VAVLDLGVLVANGPPSARMTTTCPAAGEVGLQVVDGLPVLASLKVKCRSLRSRDRVALELDADAVDRRPARALGEDDGRWGVRR
jgi:hypothetical protein